MKRVLITGMSGWASRRCWMNWPRADIALSIAGYSDYHEMVDGEWLWREDRIDALLSEEGAGLLFVQGTTRNQVKFSSRFDHIVLLSAPAEIVVERLTRRTDNPYGKDPSELAETLEYLETVEPLLREAATLEVVTTVPVA